MAAGEHLTDEQYSSQKKAVWRATLIMAVVTVLEVALAILLGDVLPLILINLMFIFMSVMKAFFIMGEFMHLKYETRALTMSILVPFLFLVWAIIAFAMEGTSWLDMRLDWLQ